MYSNKAYVAGINQNIFALITEGMGIRSIARFLHISPTTVVDRIKKFSKSCVKPFQNFVNRTYEIDELWTYVGKKSNEVWIMHRIDRETKAVVDFLTGSRNKQNIQSLTGQLLNLEPKALCTDGLNTYRSLIPAELHRTAPMSTRHIERDNLTLRMHLKRLSRKTICFSKSLEMLEACLKIYFRGMPEVLKPVK